MLIQNVLNSQFGEPRDAKKRNYISPSAFFSSYIDNYLKMNGEEYSNHPDERVQRIFRAGSTFEGIIKESFKMSGLYHSEEVPVAFKHADLVCWGYYDMRLGGNFDYNQALVNLSNFASKNTNIINPKHVKGGNYLDEIGIPIKESQLDTLAEVNVEMASKILESFQEQGIKQFTPILCEIKSMNSRAYWHHSKMAVGDKFEGQHHHKMQLWAYMHATGIEKGVIFYVSRDDLMVNEVEVMLDDKQLRDDVLGYIETMSGYYHSGKTPPLEKEILYDSEKKKFVTNKKVQYSNYITKLYGYDSGGDYRGFSSEEVTSEKGKALKIKMHRLNTISKYENEIEKRRNMNDEQLNEHINKARKNKVEDTKDQRDILATQIMTYKKKLDEAILSQPDYKSYM